VRYSLEASWNLAARYPTEPGWTTPGHVGYLDVEGYLFLTSREAGMIVSGARTFSPGRP